MAIEHTNSAPRMPAARPADDPTLVLQPVRAEPAHKSFRASISSNSSWRPPRLVKICQISPSSTTLSSQCRKARQRYRALLVLLSAQWMGLEVHATHAAARRHGGASRGLLRQLGDHGLGGDQKRRNRSCVLDSHTHDLGRVDDALGDHVAVLAGLRVEAIDVLFLLQDLTDHNRAVLAGIERDLAGWPGQRLAHDLDAGLLVVVFGADALASQRSRRSRSWARW